MTTTQTVHHYFTGPWVVVTVEPDIEISIGRSREMVDCVAVVTTVDSKITSMMTLPKDEFIQVADAVRAMI